MRCCRVGSAGAGCERVSLDTLFPSGRVINAGKSQHNEDQACCEVVFVQRRPSPKGRLLSREGSEELDGVRTMQRQGHDREGAQRESMRWGTRWCVRNTASPGIPSVSWTSCPCSLPAPLVIPTGQGWLAWGGHWPTCPRGLWRWLPRWPGHASPSEELAAETCCWQHQVCDAGLGLSPEPAVSRHPPSAAPITPAYAALGPASQRQCPVTLSSAADLSCSEFPVPSASSQAHLPFLSLPAGQEWFLFPLLGLV